MTKKTPRSSRVNGKAAPEAATPGVKVTPPVEGTSVSVPTHHTKMKPAARAKPAEAPKAAEPKGEAIAHAKASDVQKEIGPKTRVALSLPRMKAALAVAAKKDSRAQLNGVFLHAEGHTLNILATDGCHLIQSCMWRDKETDAWPKYLDKGIILDREALAKAIAFLGKDDDVKAREQVTFEFADGAASGILMDYAGDARIRIPVIEGGFPPYRAIVEQASSALLGGESTPLASTSGIAREYMKAAGTVAAALEAKAVQVVAPMDSNKPWVIVYPGCEGVLHIIMPLKLDALIGKKTLALIGTTNLKGSMAALKATITMQTRSMEEASTETAKVRHKAVIDSCKERMKVIEAAMADTTVKIAAPKAEKPAKAPRGGGKPKVVVAQQSKATH